MDQFVGEIRAVGFNFPPHGWAQCNGQLLPISQNTALFSLLGTFYGGDGRSTFALPDLQGKTPLHAGQGPGLSFRQIGEMGGESQHTLAVNEMPSHGHNVKTAAAAGTTAAAAGSVLAEPAVPARVGNRYSSAAANTALNVGAVQATGGSQPHDNMQPYLVVNYIIALQGIYPSRA